MIYFAYYIAGGLITVFCMTLLKAVLESDDYNATEQFDICIKIFAFWPVFLCVVWAGIIAQFITRMRK